MSFETPTRVAGTLVDTDFLVKVDARGNKPLLLPVSLLRDAMQVLTAEDTPVNAVAATGTITFTGTPVADETVTIGDDVYTFKASRSLAFEVTIDAVNSTQGDNLDTAVAADATGDYTSNNVAGTVTVTSSTAGVIGNSIALIEAATGTAVNGATLTGGIDGTVALNNTIYTDNSYLYVAIADNTTADANWRRISLGAAY